MPVVAEELDFVVGVDGVDGVGRSRHSPIDGLCICLIDAMSKIQGVPRLLSQLSEALISVYVDGIQYHFNHLIPTLGDFV